jgi:hypothetical protein
MAALAIVHPRFAISRAVSISGGSHENVIRPC